MFSTIVFIALVGFTIWRLIAEYRTERAAHASKAPPLPGTPAVFRVDPCTELPAACPAADRSPEGDIVTQLLDGRIDRRQYRRAMTLLATTGPAAPGDTPHRTVASPPDA